MINISGVTLPETAFWENESQHGLPLSTVEICADGTDIIYQSGTNAEIDIYLPKIAGELTRETVDALRELALSGGTLSLNINGTLKTAVFRHMDRAIDLKPINPKQTQEPNDSYYGYIRLLEV